ncbi:hypothetical protein FDT66_04565 [Polaribacter aestuariivivens]|uniref:NHL repeat containing protein n=1 Tax=Polaribacter aestuariivivens TaxID=2304626 RepID=A0A5S3N7Y8_9FLAO|nr:hypothetical protein [Polaribacter aestuariivivens]TMM31247.1 hypothetical protein FDT66_04565 [Polaribacter aestuariivivens]
MKTLKVMALFCAATLTLASCSNNDNDVEAKLDTKILFTSNNNDGNVNMYNVINLNSVGKATLTTPISAADGIYYDANQDLVVQASRSTFGVEGYANITSFATSTTVAASVTGTLDMQSPREIAVNGNMYVVADNADVDGDSATKDGKLFIYTNNGGNFTLRNTITTNFKLWGIVFIGNDLYAIEDTTNKLAVFRNFLNNTSNTTLSATKSIFVEGIVRTHGLTYDAAADLMILTDIGDAANGQDDGGFHLINNFTANFNNTANAETLALSEQVRVAGSNTLLGNPVDVAYDNDAKTVFIAEAGNGGGRILAFSNIGSGGNLTPSYNASLSKASAVYFHKE